MREGELLPSAHMKQNLNSVFFFFNYCQVSCLVNLPFFSFLFFRFFFFFVDGEVEILDSQVSQSA